MRAGFSAVNKRLDSIEYQLTQMDIRLDRIESFAHQTRSEVLALRADIKELRSQPDKTDEPTAIAVQDTSSGGSKGRQRRQT
jgi:archaellum component FlaC